MSSTLLLCRTRWENRRSVEVGKEQYGFFGSSAGLQQFQYLYNPLSAHPTMPPALLSTIPYIFVKKTGVSFCDFLDIVFCKIFVGRGKIEMLNRLEDEYEFLIQKMIEAYNLCYLYIKTTQK